MLNLKGKLRAAVASRSCEQQLREKGAQIEATVASILGIGEVAMGVYGEIEGAMGSAHGVPSGATPARSPDFDAFRKSVSTACRDRQRPDPGIANSPAPGAGCKRRLIRSPTGGHLSAAGYCRTGRFG